VSGLSWERWDIYEGRPAGRCTCCGETLWEVRLASTPETVWTECGGIGEGSCTDCNECRGAGCAECEPDDFCHDCGADCRETPCGHVRAADNENLATDRRDA
jgi:hypothetical protein